MQCAAVISRSCPGLATTLAVQKAYVDKYHNFPAFTAFTAYDGVMAFAEAIKRAGSTDPDKIVAAQNGIRFVHDLHTGQKTGGFLDQRENHRAAAKYASGQVLDCFTYHGGFALTIAAKADRVEATDLSGAAITIARENQQLNNIANVTFSEANSFDALKAHDSSGRKFDMVILDPPAFAKNRESVPAAVRGYKEINLRALKILKPGGTLVTCSCSYHIPEALFLNVIAEAANDARRATQVIERRAQARDHPILLTMPETHYLKCFILKVLE